MVSYFQLCHSTLPMMFGLLCSMQLRCSYDLTFLRQFYKEYLPRHYTVEEKRKIVQSFLQLCAQQDSSENIVRQKQFISYTVVYPILKAPRGPEVMDAETLNMLFNFVRSKRPRASNNQGPSGR